MRKNHKDAKNLNGTTKRKKKENNNNKKKNKNTMKHMNKNRNN